MPALDPSQLNDPSSNDEILDAFLNYLIEEGIEPYDHQEEAIHQPGSLAQNPGAVWNRGSGGLAR